MAKARKSNFYSFCYVCPKVPNATKEELMILTVSEIISHLLKSIEEKRDVDLNK